MTGATRIKQWLENPIFKEWAEMNTPQITGIECDSDGIPHTVEWGNDGRWKLVTNPTREKLSEYAKEKGVWPL